MPSLQPPIFSAVLPRPRFHCRSLPPKVTDVPKVRLHGGCCQYMHVLQTARPYQIVSLGWRNYFSGQIPASPITEARAHGEVSGGCGTSLHTLLLAEGTLVLEMVAASHKSHSASHSATYYRVLRRYELA